MTTLQLFGFVMLGGFLGFAACAILQMNRDDVIDDRINDSMRLDHLIKSSRNIVCTTIGGRNWWSVVPNDSDKSTATSLNLRDAIDSDIDIVSEAEITAELTSNG